MDIAGGIRKRVEDGAYEYSKHAVDQTILRGISAHEVREALLSPIEIIEDYPDDFYGPSCLVLGFTSKRRPIHVVCSHPSRLLLKLVTVYEPAGDEWIDFRKRR